MGEFCYTHMFDTSSTGNKHDYTPFPPNKKANELTKFVYDKVNDS